MQLALNNHYQSFSTKAVV